MDSPIVLAARKAPRARVAGYFLLFVVKELAIPLVLLLATGVAATIIMPPASLLFAHVTADDTTRALYTLLRYAPATFASVSLLLATYYVVIAPPSVHRRIEELPVLGKISLGVRLHLLGELLSRSSSFDVPKHTLFIQEADRICAERPSFGFAMYVSTCYLAIGKAFKDGATPDDAFATAFPYNASSILGALIFVLPERENMTRVPDMKSLKGLARAIGRDTDTWRAAIKESAQDSHPSRSLSEILYEPATPYSVAGEFASSLGDALMEDTAAAIAGGTCVLGGLNFAFMLAVPVYTGFIALAW